MVWSRSSARRERSSIVPMKMKNGIASSTWLAITPNTRSGNSSR